jgi:hypothetical protein
MCSGGKSIMKYQCIDPACKAIFIHPAKLIDSTPTKNEQYIQGAVLESYVCPACKGIFFSEYDEPQPQITSVVSVELSQVDSYLKQGYVVHDLYAKTATLKKLEVKQA